MLELIQVYPELRFTDEYKVVVVSIYIRMFSRQKSANPLKVNFSLQKFRVHVPVN